MLAKGAAIGVQFEALMKNDLFDNLASHANAMAMRLAAGIKEAGYGFLCPPETNLILPLFPANVAERLHQLYGFFDWESAGDMTAVRIVTSWATSESIVEQFIADLSYL